MKGGIGKKRSEDEYEGRTDVPDIPITIEYNVRNKSRKLLAEEENDYNIVV